MTPRLHVRHGHAFGHGMRVVMGMRSGMILRKANSTSVRCRTFAAFKTEAYLLAAPFAGARY